MSGIRPERGDALEEVASAPSSSRVDSFGGGHPAGDEVTVLRSPTALLAAVSGSPIVQARPPSARLVVGGSSSLTPAHAPGSELRRRPSSRQVASPGTLWALRERAQQPQHDAAAAGRGASGIHRECAFGDNMETRWPVGKASLHNAGIMLRLVVWEFWCLALEYTEAAGLACSPLSVRLGWVWNEVFWRVLQVLH